MKTLLLKSGIIFSLLFSMAYAQNKSSSPNYKQMAISYVKKQLKSPASAQIVQYEGNANSRKVLSESGFDLAQCQKVSIVVIDAQNSYGAMLRNYFFVFFKNDKPCHMEDVKSLGSASSWMDKTTMLRTTLKMNYCDCQ
jgi:hypothetical protein